MNGKKFIDKICDILDKENIRLYDSQIVIKIKELNQYEFENLIKYDKVIKLKNK